QRPYASSDRTCRADRDQPHRPETLHRASFPPRRTARPGSLRRRWAATATPHLLPPTRSTPPARSTPPHPNVATLHRAETRGEQARRRTAARRGLERPRAAAPTGRQTRARLPVEVSAEDCELRRQGSAASGPPSERRPPNADMTAVPAGRQCSGP